jgi:hypothetical protein
MTLLFTYALLLLLMLISIGRGIHANVPSTTLIAQIGGLVGLTAAFLQNLTKNSLTVYFFWQRLRVRFNTKAVTRWSFSVRFDGQFGPDALLRAIGVLSNPKKYAYPVRIEASDNRSALLSIDNSLLVSASLEMAEFSEASTAGGDEVDHIAVVSKTQELPYRFSVEKIEKQILPLLSIMKDELRPSKSSYELDVAFRGTNPFFEVYIARLRPDQIDDFRVILHVDSGTPNRKERVEISRTNIHVTAASTDSFKRLANDFILLSPDVKMLTGVQKSA